MVKNKYNYAYTPDQTVSIINKVMMAYFLNIICYEIDMEYYKPTMPAITQLLHEKNINPEHNAFPMKEFFHGKVIIEDFDFKFLSHTSIEDFMTDEIKKSITDVAKDFLTVIKQHKYCDLAFIQLPDAAPYISSCDHDPETNFIARIIAGTNFSDNKTCAIFEFYGLILNKFRLVEELSANEKIYIAIEQMTEEERAKYDLPHERTNQND